MPPISGNDDIHDDQIGFQGLVLLHGLGAVFGLAGHFVPRPTRMFFSIIRMKEASSPKEFSEPQNPPLQAFFTHLKKQTSRFH